MQFRDAATLELREQWTIDISERDPNQLNGTGWLTDLECHNADGGLITYLPLVGRGDNFRGAPMPDKTELHVWSDGVLTGVGFSSARAAAVDPVEEQIFAIVGDDGRILEVRDFEGALLDSLPLPDEHVGWKLARNDRTLAILARHSPLEPINWYFAEVDSVVLLDLDSGAWESHRLPTAGSAIHLEPLGDGFAAAASHVMTLATPVAVITDDVEVVAESGRRSGPRSRLGAGR